MALFATMVALVAPAQAPAAPPVAVLPRGCGHVHAAPKARRRLRSYVRSDRPWLRRSRVRHLRRCVAAPGRRRALTTLTRKWIRWRQTYAPSWRIRFHRLPAWAQSWARSTSYCETGGTMDPRTETGNGFVGAFQFLPSTWWAAGGDRWPSAATWHHQAVIAVRWLYVAGDEQWPNCGD